MAKAELINLWQEYKEIRKWIDLPVNQNEEQTILSFLNWVSTAPKPSPELGEKE
jgi:hypothetical protein